MDFYKIIISEKKDGTLQARPDWTVGKSKDLMTRGGSFYAVWDEQQHLWSTDIYDVQRLVDDHLNQYAQEYDSRGIEVKCSLMENNSSKLWDEFQRFIRNSGSYYHHLDEKLIFADTEVKREDYAAKRLSYSLKKGKCEAWDMIVGTLYSEEERAKIEWAIGAIISGDSKLIQKFLVFYGPPASGKSTILNIIQKLFDGYCSVFDARELAGNNNAFATSAFKSNPLVAVQHDGDLSRIYDNTKLNSIVAHETMTINEKYKTPFESKSHAFLFMGTNVPVKITDAKSGTIRRLIDVVPTQKTIDHDRYHNLMNQIDFELGAIAYHCLQRFNKMGKNYYSGYRPKEMMLQTDIFYNYVESCFDVFKDQDSVTLKQAWTLYKEYCEDTGISKMLPQYKFREELKNYFEVFEERARIDGVNVRSYYTGFKHLEATKPQPEFPIKSEGVYELEFKEIGSIFDDLYSGLPAQYAKENGTPSKKWESVKTVLADLDTSKLHYVKVPENHIVIDFDLMNEDGEKDFQFNLREASKWPATYAEVSKSGEGIHLHYIYTGDISELSNVYDVGIEIKTLTGDSSLRRKLTLCNDMNITPLDGGLPKKEKPMLSDKSIKSEKGLREMLARNLRKEVHPGTKPSVDFIKKILDEAYESGIAYDVTDMRSDILTFALKSTNQSETCVKTVQKMKFASESQAPSVDPDNIPLTFYDVEVYPNLFIVCWKHENSDKVVRMINPEPNEIEPLFKMKLVGFNNRKYDNHVIYARYLGYSLDQLYQLNKRLFDREDKDSYFGEAYNLSYTDIFDFSSKKQSLKRFEIELGIAHMELDIPYAEAVPEELWPQVEDYCVNDVIATQAVFEERKQDFVARQILAELSGLSVNHTTQQHTARIVFGKEKNPQKSFEYPDISETFPGYALVFGEDNKPHNIYREEDAGFGGYVHAEPGIYTNVALLDIASQHPTSIEILDLFGHYTARYSELKEARLAIKRKDYETASTMLDGKLTKFLGEDEDAEALSYALKIALNIVYGLTSASFPNAFKDNRNKNNIVALRGALFMIDLKHAVQEQDFTVAHIKTDSIKIPNATPEIIQFVTDFGKKYGYDFEHEATYDWFCLVNDAVYIARKDDNWTAVGAQYQQPYVYKTLLSHEPLEFKDFCEMKNVREGTMYLEFLDKGLVHVGRTGSFVPVIDGGGVLLRIKDDKRYAVTGTKDYLWITNEVALELEKSGQLKIDMSYFEHLKQQAIDNITKFDDVSGLSQKMLGL